MSFGDLVVGWLLLRQAGRGAGEAADRLARGQGVLRGQGRRARWFAASVLPELSAKRAVAEATDLSLMQLDEAAF
jgi:hypothetical protein